MHSPAFVELVSPVTSLLSLVSLQEFLSLLVLFFSTIGGFEKSWNGPVCTYAQLR